MGKLSEEETYLSVNESLLGGTREIISPNQQHEQKGVDGLQLRITKCSRNFYLLINYTTFIRIYNSVHTLKYYKIPIL